MATWHERNMDMAKLQETRERGKIGTGRFLLREKWRPPGRWAHVKRGARIVIVSTAHGAALETIPGLRESEAGSRMSRPLELDDFRHTCCGLGGLCRSEMSQENCRTLRQQGDHTCRSQREASPKKTRRRRALAVCLARRFALLLNYGSRK